MTSVTINSPKREQAVVVTFGGPPGIDGVDGASAAEQLADAGIIAEPSVDALVEWLRNAALDLVSPPGAVADLSRPLNLVMLGDTL